jgi:hypothetical protein
MSNKMVIMPKKLFSGLSAVFSAVTRNLELQNAVIVCSCTTPRRLFIVMAYTIRCWTLFSRIWKTRSFVSWHYYLKGIAISLANCFYCKISGNGWYGNRDHLNNGLSCWLRGHVKPIRFRLCSLNLVKNKIRYLPVNLQAANRKLV